MITLSAVVIAMTEVHTRVAVAAIVIVVVIAALLVVRVVSTHLRVIRSPPLALPLILLLRARVI
jgi:hypothetical protein